MTSHHSTRVSFCPFEVDFRTRELWKQGVRLKLSGQPFQVLELLLEKPGELVSRDQLRARIWQDDTFVDFSHGLNAAVNKLREALSDSAQTPRYIETLPRRGYRFIAPVDRPAPATPEIVPLVAPKPLPRDLLLFIAAIFVATTLAFFLHAQLTSPRAEAHGISVPRIHPLTGITDSTGAPAFSPDGNYVAFYREAAKPEDSGIYVNEVGTERLTRLTRNFDECCPAWSPDGRSVAFTRKDKGIFTAPFRASSDQPEIPTVRKLDTGSVIPKPGDHAEIDWSPDGTSIAFSAASAINLVSLVISTVTRLTTPPPNADDWGPSFSSDGKRLLFVRTGGPGIPDQIMLAPTDGGQPTPVVSELGCIHGTPRWSSDEQSVIYSSKRDGQSSLWRASIDKREPPVQINDNGWQPAVARKQNRLAYQRLTRGLNIWESNLPAESARLSHVLIASTSQTDQGPGPQFSPDDRKLAFMSDRSGTMEIWVSDSDGSNPYQLSAVGNAGTPRWSPDSRAIVFDARGRHGMVIYAVNLDGGAPRLLTPDKTDFDAVCPSWSRDGNWVYFASSAGGSRQVWKVPSAGGAPVQITRFGGHAAFESFDGKYLYYAKTIYANPEIWRIPVDGGREDLVSSQLRPASWASWVVVDNGIVFATSSGKNGPVVNIFDFSTHRVSQLASLDVVPFWLTATRDAKTIAFDKPGWQQAQTMLVENFR